MTTVLPGARIGEQRRRHIGQAEGIVQFPMQEQSTI